MGMSCAGLGLDELVRSDAVEPCGRRGGVCDVFEAEAEMLFISRLCRFNAFYL